MSAQSRVLEVVGRSGAAVLLLLLVLPVVATVLLRTLPRFDLLFESPGFHVVVVSAIAACALMVALFTAVVAARVRRAAPVLLALGCVCIGFLMLGHGLTTPGILGRPMNMWVARFPVLAIAGFALCLMAATADEDSVVKRVVARHPRALLMLVTLGLAVFSLVIVARPTALWGTEPFPGETAVTDVVIVASALGLLLAGAIHWRRWRLSGDRVELALVLACWLSVDSLVSFELGHLWRLSWWDYHAYLLAGFAAAAWAVVAESRRTRSLEGALAGISVTDPVEHIVRGYPEALHALTAAVEAKDRYTHGHSTRVADLSTKMGLRIGLDPDTLRGLARGALLHDIGKIGVPDHVLNKPGALTPDEWEWIVAHPVVGWEMASRTPSLRDALAVVRHHHERWDGSGYPDRLEGKGIPMAARIAAVADVWDALTSDRAYRPAWPPEQALDHLMGGMGSLFDPVCIEALVDLMAEQDLGPGAVKVAPDVLEAAARTCHAHRGQTRVSAGARRPS
jgi:HD-GYP domain-containing protein (c-di-GMP phosphodiesterase class II)